jgi:hypothetical protein
MCGQVPGSHPRINIGIAGREFKNAYWSHKIRFG